ncbi:MAG: GFA family protein [Erythrobacter sp.]
MVKITGGCHCGAVQFEADVPAEPVLLDCNCSVCSMTGYLHLTIPHGDFVLKSGADVLTSYKFGTKTADHLFCSQCGIKSYYQPRSHPDSWSVNYNCVDANSSLDPEIVTLDGKNWEEAVKKLRAKPKG